MPAIERFAVVLAVAASPVLLLAQNPRGGARPAPPVEFTQAESYSIGASLELPGSVEALRRAEVATQVEGLVVKLLVREGDRVKRGQKLAELDTASLEARKKTLEADVVEAETRLRSAESRHRRAESLFADRLISDEELDIARYEQEALEARRVSLQASIGELELQLRQSVISAPFDGAVTEKRTEVGQWLQEGAAVVTLLSLEELEVAIEVPEVHIGRVRLGQSAQVKLDAFPTEPLAGKVSVMVPEADPDARTFPVKIRVPSGGGRVRTGMTATVTLAPSSPRQATIVPKDALVSEGNGWVVFVLEPDETVKQVGVVIGEGVGQWVEIQAELQSGERVITRGNERLRPGQTVRPAPREYPAP